MLKEKVLYALERQKGTVVTGGELAKNMGVSRTSIWKAVHALQQDGNDILTIPNIGYKLLPTNDTLSAQVLSDRLSTRFIGRSITLLSSVNSTNQYLKEQDAVDFKNGHVVVADEQLNGRGRRNRSFLSPKSDGVYFSILLKLDGQQNDIRLLTICAAVAVSRAVEQLCGVKTGIKWVNDVFLGGRKICGILTEAILSGELQELDTVIVGIGINTRHIPDEIRDIATSIGEETGIYGIRNGLVAEVLNQFERTYLDYAEQKEISEILKYYENRLFIKGQRVVVIRFQNEYAATVLGIDKSGALIIQTETGETERLLSGEIRLC